MSSAGFILRQFIFPDDFSAVIDLWGHAGPGIHLGRSDTYEEIGKKVRYDPDLFLVAEQDRHMVGALMGGFDGRRGLMYHLAVDPTIRQQGIGQALMEEMELRLCAKGCLKCYLLVVPENTDAIHFYEKRGWERMNLNIYGKELS